MSSGLGQEFTQNVISSMGPGTSPRLRTVMTSLIQHVHDFAREVDLTMDEWLLAVDLINWSGRMSNEKRNEGQLLCDIIGLESLVDDITARAAARSSAPSSASAILGPFWRADTPLRRNGSSISFNTPADGQLVHLSGQVTGADTGLPLANASVEVWQASTNGLYEQQDPDQVEHNLRGKFVTDADGRYSFYCLRPTEYPIPGDGPAGKLLQLMDRHRFRPAHIHFIVQAAGYGPLTTQIFDKDSKYLDDDAVFAVKDSLRVEFVPREGDPEAKLQLEYNVKLAKGES